MYFPSETASLFFIIACIVWALSELIGSRIIPAVRRQGKTIEYQDNGSQYLFTGSIFLSVIIAFLFATGKTAMLPDWTTYVGTILMVLGIVIRQWSIVVLGKFFSPTVGIQKGQRIVRTGPYRLVRHPSYSGSFLIATGVGVSLQSWGAVLVILCILSLAFIYRISVEEKVLITEFGDEYVEYSRATKLLIPYIL